MVLARKQGPIIGHRPQMPRSEAAPATQAAPATKADPAWRLGALGLANGQVTLSPMAIRPSFMS